MAPPATPTGASALARITLPLKIVLGAGMTLLVAFSYWIMFFTDISNKIDQEHKRGDDLVSALNKANQAEASYRADRDQLNVLLEQTREFNKSLPAEKQQAAFLSALQQASSTAGVDLLSYTPIDEQPQAFFVKDPMRLEVSGKYFQITKFMYEVGKLERIINMENIELNDPKINGDEISMKARCLATAFHTLKAKTAGQGGQ